MKKIIMILAALLVATSQYGFAQNADQKKDDRKKNKEERVEKKKAAEADMAYVVDSLLNAKRFVLEANYLSNQYGNRVVVPGNLNFILIDSDKVVIQIGSNNRMQGPNGLGGITTTGRIISFEVKKAGKKQGYYIIKLTTMTPLGTYDIWMNVSPSSYTDAYISGLTSGKLNYHGVIRSVESSTVFKGMSI